MFHDADALLLARLQFGFTVSFHFIFPAFSIGLASYLAVLEALWLKTGKSLYLDLYKYWLKIFAITFAMGVVSGIVLSYQFGTNWSVFSDRAGPVIGPLMAYEVLTAFFLEAGFLGVMLFGMQKVGKRLHFAATLMVAIGTFISAFWILSVNSWMQTPVGHAINADGQFVPARGWFEIIFNPSFPYRLVHTVIAAYLTTALCVGAVGAWHLLKDSTQAHARKMFSMAMWMAALVAPVQVVVGDQHGLNTLEHQPAKVMAMEGHFQSHPDGAPLILFGIPNDEEQRMEHAIEIPKLGSLILKHDLDAPLAGLDTIAPENRPPVEMVFWSFRVMVGLGTLMLLLGVCSLVARAARKLYDWRWLARFALLMGPSGFIAVIAGWITTEVGRQPYTIYGLLRTADSVSPLAAPAVATSLDRVRHRVFRGVRHGHVVPAAPHVARAAAARTGSAAGAGACRGHHARARVHRARQGGELMAEATVLTNVWAAILAFAVFMYVVMDGFDLGIGILFPVFGVGRERDTAMNSIAPVWDGNETWLVLGGGGLLAAFPLAYSIVLSALYAPLIAMLLALVFRGVAFEFRWRDPAHRPIWDFAFTAGSLVASFAQGITLGALLQGIAVEGRAYGGGWWDWLTPFSLLTGVSVVAGYSLLGACWLNWKTDGETQKHARRLMRILAPVTLLAILAVSLATPFLGPQYFDRWFAMPGVLFTAQVPLIIAILTWRFVRSLRRDYELAPFVLTLAVFGLSFVGLGISMYPYLIPNSITLQMAAAPESSQIFMLIGAAVLVPIILAYTAWSYWVFRGKVAHEGYH